MICTTKTQAFRVANYGANKMDAAGYRYELISGSLYEVSKPGQAGVYFVDFDADTVEVAGGEFCTCGFAKENQAHGVCKHKLWIERAIEAGAPYEDRAEYENFGKYDLMAGKF